jgi:hypothetical protein
MRAKTVLSPDRQWDLTAALVAREFEPDYYGLVNQRPSYPIYHERPLPGAILLCQARTTTRLYLRGDLFVANYHANDIRQPVWGISSRGYHLRYYWVDLFRRAREAAQGQPVVYDANRTHMRWVELPGELVGKHPIDPDVRSYVIETLRAGDSESE